MTPCGGFHGPALALYQRLDGLFADWAAQWGAEEHLFPPFIPAAALARVDYFHSFPHLATFPVVLESGADTALEDGALRRARFAPPREVLTPAACYHFYYGLQGARTDAPLYLTTRATCFRREAHYAPLERQWSFSMREIVCVGSADEVRDFLARMQDRLTAFFRERRLPVEWQAATDPFFNPSRNARYLAQKLDPVKTEMVLDARLAIGSLNFHRNYFGEAFDIRRGDAPAYSGCVAFGIERWMHAFSDRGLA